MERRAALSDGLSRLVGALALVLALGGSTFLYIQNQQLTARLTALEAGASSGDADSSGDLAERVNNLMASDKAFKDKWDKQLTAEVVQFQSKIDALFSEQRQALSKEIAAVSQHNVDPGQIETVVDRKLVEFRKLVLDEVRPPLRVAQNLMKANANSDVPMAVIANDGSQDVGVEAVSFQPVAGGQFEVDLADLKDAQSDWTIAFTSAENTATQADRHYHYERGYGLDKQWLSAGRSTRVLVKIENAKHIGWGLSGVLVLRYDGGRTLRIENARAIFVAPSKQS